MFNNFLNSIDSTTNIAIKSKEATMPNNVARSFIKPPTMNAASKFQAAKQNSRGRKLISTSMTIGSSVINAYGTTQPEETLAPRPDVMRSVGSSLDAPLN